MSSFTKYEGKMETLNLLQDPFYYGLGHYKDTEGNNWDINATFGKYICARQICGQSYYGTATWDSSSGFHEWISYFVKCKEPKMPWTVKLDEK